jgi:protocatechuate 4,5-dioxygenase alpha chain
MPRDGKASMSEKPQVPGTYLFGLEDSRLGYPLNKLFASFKSEQNRLDFQRDEAAYCARFGVSPAQQKAILDRDWTAMLDLGGSIFYVYKLAQLDKRSMQYLGGVFTGMTTEEFMDALRAGGRSFG